MTDIYSIAYIWPDGEFILDEDCGLSGICDALGYTKSDDYLTIYNNTDLESNEVINQFNDYESYLDFIIIVDGVYY